MTFEELKKATKPYNPVLLLEDIISRRKRKMLRDVIIGIALLSFLLIQIGTLVPSHLVYGACFLLFAALILITVADAFYFSFYFWHLDPILNETALEAGSEIITLEVASLVYHSYPDDITAGFLRSEIAEIILVRCGINPSDVKTFLDGRETPLSAENFGDVVCIDGEGGISVTDYVAQIFKQDKEFQEFLFQHQIQEKEFIGATSWVEDALREEKLRLRWWGKDHLARIQGIGKDWAYGNAYTLLKYATDITDSGLGEERSKHTLLSEVEEIEKILCRNRSSNVILVGDDETRKDKILSSLAGKISRGDVFAPLEHKRLFVLNASLLVDLTKEKAAFEVELIQILNEAIKAGNVILVFKDFSTLLSGAKALHSEVLSLMETYFASSHLQIIAFSGTGSYRQDIEPNELATEYFEKVTLVSDNEGSLLDALCRSALSLEYKSGVFFTYPALVAVAQSVARYYMDASPLDKALDILFELIPYAHQKKKGVIGKEEVLALLGTKTGIPLGEVTPKEKGVLADLESVLHKRIVGQDEAIKAIASALRRARSGVGSKDRPMGSFLFLGPTGVGKTETTKALAATFFGDESKILRLDMSEYRTDDALERLIGSFEGGKPGVLTSMLREHPYGVLLLDEFEKTMKEVLDLFLQIIDEGIFSDMAGKKVNARNLIIIATSNAGSDIIFKTVESGKDLQAEKNNLIDSIIEQGIFKPELLNRFDGVILFRPLNDEELRKIATLMLTKLQARLREKGVEFVINDATLDEVVKAGTDPKFGARPMNRAVQDKVEQLVADKMIRGEISSGSKVELTSADFA
ncbi:MAG: AAA family ATPase [Candidatus Pacebacteria bacterium]|nr:AAA family ATPase [Candidatus Paceibacterota bacterium]